MTEIEKMFENAGVEKRAYWGNCPNHQYLSNNLTCYKCEYFSVENPYLKCSYRVYPPFTAEKQIELIKFLLKNYKGVDINKKNNRFNFLVDNDTFIGCHHNDKSFEESLVGVINKLWQSLTDQEKEEIRRILNE